MATPTEDATFIDHVSQSTIPRLIWQSTWVRELPHHLRDYHCYYTIFSHHEPSSYKEVISNPLWQQAIFEKLQALEKGQTWELVALPLGKIAVGCKWVYKIRSDGSIERYKAHLVARGFT